MLGTCQGISPTGFCNKRDTYARCWIPF